LDSADCSLNLLWHSCPTHSASAQESVLPTSLGGGFNPIEKNSIKQIGSFLRVEEVPDSPDFFGLTLRVVEVGWDSHNSLGAGIISNFLFPARMHLSLREIRA